MSNKILPEAQAREKMASIIQESKRRFTVQNQKTGMLSFAAEARYALEKISNSKLLLKCDPETLKDSMVHLAAVGLSLNPASQQMALIPRWNTKKNSFDCTASPMYRGLMKLATDTGLINNITAEVVYEFEDDGFDVDLGSKPYLIHKPKFSSGTSERVIDLVDLDKNKMIAAYCIAHLKNSEWPHITVMDLSEVQAIAGASDAFNPRKEGKKPSGPWVYWCGEMVKKAVIRRASKQWPLSDDSRYQRLLLAIEADNRAETNEQRTEVRAEQIEAEMGELVTEEQVAQIKDLCSTQGLDHDTVYSNYSVNALSKIQMKYFDEIEEKLLDRQRRYNAAKEPKPDPIEDQLDSDTTRQELE
ncbi:hypothetical protein LCGC14_0373570 [marine sediment metagenome]|uniref:Uncharacterized protein n=1 Tax=marine sediment metagenome TaxID=412755 RepID=A0A0F9TMJ5_9ZZZZ